MKINKVLYWTSTVLLCLLMAYSASMYFTNIEIVKGFFFNLVLATAAHHYGRYGIVGFSLYGLLLIFPSYFLGKQIRN